jgi:hypothetical protein
MNEQVEKLVRLAGSTNAVAAEIAKKKLSEMGLDSSGNPLDKPKAEKKTEAKPESKPEKKKAAGKSKPAAKTGEKKSAGRKPDVKIPEGAETITFKGKTYTLDDCEALFNAWQMKKKGAAKASEESQAKSTVEKVVDKAETTISQILKDKAAKKKIENDPKAAKKELGQIEVAMRRFIQAVETFLGKRIPESKVRKIFAALDAAEIMEDGGAFARIYEGNEAEFAMGGGMDEMGGEYFSYEVLAKNTLTGEENIVALVRAFGDVPHIMKGLQNAVGGSPIEYIHRATILHYTPRHQGNFMDEDES